VVIGVADAQWGECGWRYAAASPTRCARQIIEFVGQRIARFKNKHVVFAAQPPRTASGQIDRQAVKWEHGQG
jgi:acyl-CoA synthetase (AMP-forming)/AMP-acid ligase II